MSLGVFVVDDFSYVQHFHYCWLLFTLKGLCFLHSLYATRHFIDSCSVDSLYSLILIAYFTVYITFISDTSCESMELHFTHKIVSSFYEII